MQSKFQGNLILSKSLLICNSFFDLEQSALESFIKNNMNTDICKLLYPSRIYCFSKRQLYTQEKYLLLSGCRGHLVLDAKKSDAKSSTRVCEMKSLTCSLLTPLN